MDTSKESNEDQVGFDYSVQRENNGDMVRLERIAKKQKKKQQRLELWMMEDFHNVEPETMTHYKNLIDAFKYEVTKKKKALIEMRGSR